MCKIYHHIHNIANTSKCPSVTIILFYQATQEILIHQNDYNGHLSILYIKLNTVLVAYTIVHMYMHV